MFHERVLVEPLSVITQSLPSDVVVLERGWLSSNTIVLLGADPVVIDTGHHRHAEQLLALLEHWLGEQHPQRLLNTHLHSDHCGGNARLQARWPQLLTLIPHCVFEATKEWSPSRLPFESTGQNCPRFAVHAALRGGQEIILNGRTWEIHECPGHDADGVLFFEPRERILISADALWENGFGVLFDALESEFGFDAQEQTLNLIESLHARWVLPGHGRAFQSVKPSIARARSRLAHWRQHPLSHAEHAAHVLIKFHVMVHQTLALQEFMSWADQVSLLKRIHAQDPRGIEFEAWLLERLDVLCAKKAVQLTPQGVLDA